MEQGELFDPDRAETEVSGDHAGGKEDEELDERHQSHYEVKD